MLLGPLLTFGRLLRKPRSCSVDDLSCLPGRQRTGLGTTSLVVCPTGPLALVFIVSSVYSLMEIFLEILQAA